MGWESNWSTKVIGRRTTRRSWRRRMRSIPYLMSWVSTLLRIVWLSISLSLSSSKYKRRLCLMASSSSSKTISPKTVHWLQSLAFWTVRTVWNQSSWNENQNRTIRKTLKRVKAQLCLLKRITGRLRVCCWVMWQRSIGLGRCCLISCLICSIRVCIRILISSWRRCRSRIISTSIFKSIRSFKLMKMGSGRCISSYRSVWLCQINCQSKFLKRSKVCLWSW